MSIVTTRYKFDRIVFLQPELPTYIGYSFENDFVGKRHEINDVDLGEKCLTVNPKMNGDWEIVADWPVFVNSKECNSVCDINNGDMIRFEGYLWEFLNVPGTPPRLVPNRFSVAPTIRILNVGVTDRLAEVSIEIQPGTLVAITGETGAGKSTFAKAIVGKIATNGEVQLLQGPSDFFISNADRGSFSSKVAFVPQENVLHSDLTVQQHLWHWGKLQDKGQGENQINRALELVDLKVHAHKFVDELSGGMKRRLAIACALVRQQPVMVMDEPASGLDPNKEQELLRVIRRVCSVGVTAIVVTHGLQFCDAYDAEIKLGKNADSNLGEIRSITGVGVTRFDPKPGQAQISASFGATRSPFLFFESLAKRTWPLLQRETRKLFQRDRMRILGTRSWLPGYATLNLLCIPVLFGIAVGLATPIAQVSTLAVLSIVSSIWMSMSMASTSLVDERELIDHEVHQGTSLLSILLAKLTTLVAIAVCQCIVLFFTMLVLRRAFLGSTNVLSGLDLKLVPILVLVSFAGVNLGLLISSIAGKSPRKAAVLVPLILMIQILFNPLVAQKDKLGQTAGPSTAYRNFCIKHCGGSSHCNNPNLEYRQRFSDWLCDDCCEQAKNHLSQRKMGPLSAIEQKNIEDKLDLHETEKSVSRFVNWFAAVISQFTLTRYADAAYRECVTDSDGESIFRAPAASDNLESDSPGLLYSMRVSWFWQGVATLVFFSISSFVATLSLMKLQTWMALQTWRKSR